MSPARGSAAGRRRAAKPRRSAAIPRRQVVPDVASFAKFLRSIGVDPRRDPTFAATAELAADLLARRTAGLREKIRPIQAMPYRGRAGETVAVEEIPVYGLCPHHLVPFFGKVRVSYVPRRSVGGPGSIARLVRDLSLAPRIQEDLTQALADQLQRALKPRSLEVVIRARHLCAELRGVEQKVQFVTEARRSARR